MDQFNGSLLNNLIGKNIETGHVWCGSR